MNRKMSVAFNKILEIAQEKCDEGTYLQIANLLKEAHNEKNNEIEDIDRIIEICDGYNFDVIKHLYHTSPTHEIYFIVDVINENSYDNNFTIEEKEFKVFVNENSSLYRNAKNIKIISLNRLKAEDMTDDDVINICQVGNQTIKRSILGRVVKVKKITKKMLKTIEKNCISIQDGNGFNRFELGL